MKGNYETYEAAMYDNDNKKLAKNLQGLVKDHIEIEKEPETLKEIMNMDLRDNVPPQLYELISCVVDMVQKVEERVHEHESK